MHNDSEPMQFLDASISALFEDHVSIMLLIDPSSGTIRRVNQAAAQFYGYSRSELCAMDIMQICADDPDQMKVVLQQALRKEQNRCVGVQRIAGGDLRTVEMHMSPLTINGQLVLFSIIYDITEHVRAEQALRQSKQLLHESQLIANSGSWTADLLANSIDLTPEGAFLVGLTAGIHTLDDLWALIHPDDVQALQATWNAIRRGEPFDIEGRILLRGEVRWLHTRAKLNRNEQGVPVSALGITHDITERKRIEAALRAEQLRFAKVSDTIPGAICTFLLRPDGTICIPYASKMFEDLYGLKLADVRENIDALIARVPDDHVARLIAQVGESARTFQPWRNEYQYQHPTKGTIWIEGYSMPVHEPDGSIAWHGVSIDITERKRAEEQLRASERRFATIFHASPVGMIITRMRDNRVEDINTAALAIFGYRREELIGHTALDVGLWADLHDRQRLMEELRQHQEVHAFEAIFCHHCGERRFMLVSAEVTELNDEPSMLFQIVDITERKRAEEQIRESQMRAELAFKGANLGMWDWYVQTGRTVFNDRWAEIVGYTLAELEPISIHTWDDLCHPDDLAHSQALLAQHFAGMSEIYECEARMRHKDGRWIWVIDRGQVVEWDTDGKPLRMAGTHLDITERKQADQVLRELNQTLEERVRQRTAEVQDLYENAPIGYHALDANGTVVMINQTQLDWLGYSREELLGRSIANFLTPKSIAEFGAGFPAFKEHGSVHNIEFEMVRKDGTIIPVLLSATALYDEHGNYVMSRSTVFDNSERKLTDTALRESEEQNRLLFEESPDAVVLFRDDGTLVQLNRAFEQLTGYRASQLIGQRLNDIGLVPHETILQIASVVTAHLHANTNFASVELRLRRASGEFRDVGVRVFGILIRGQRHYLTTMRDITTEKQVEETLRQANTELARAARAKDEFLANMSHELRTPLNAILGLSETLLEEFRGPLNTEQQRSVRNIEASGRHLLALITDILDLSKVEAGRLELQVEPVIIADVCQSSMLFVKEQAIKKSLRLAFTLNDQMAEMEADVRRLKQILVNLLSNAVKFTPDRGEVSLKVEVDTDAGVIRFAVQDTGIGIAPDDMVHLFQPFKQLDSSLSRQHDGTGLGLALVHRLTELHGGSVVVESELGQGSCFTISLPYHLPASIISEPYQLDSDLKNHPSSLQSALVVEDMESAAEQLTRYLQEASVRVFVHRQGMGAVEQAIRLQPNVIFLDILMPDRSGWDVLNHLKAEPRTCNIPVVIVTVVDDRSRGLAAGASDYILKPFTREILRRTLHIVVAATKHDMQQALVIVPRQAPPPATKARILLVEDNEVNILTISDYLQACGYALCVARNGHEALSQIDESRPDLILMDIQMPEMDGLEATRRLRAIPAYAQVPIIALTALAMPGDRERCLLAGANDYLTKPVSLKGLAARMRQLLGGS